MILLGGFTNFFGPMLGSVIFITLRDVISSFIEYWRFIFGALLAVIVIFAPGGVMEIFTVFFNLIRKKIMPEREHHDSGSR
jgi:branched-chain amino acid transport system permease protein